MPSTAIADALRGGNPLAATSDVTEAGRIHVNGFVSTTEMQSRLHNQQSYYGGKPAQPAHLHIVRGDVLLARRRSPIQSRSGFNETGQVVFSTLNGAFKKGQSIQHIKDRLQLAGVASTEAIFDGRSYMSTDIAIAVGGLRTIYNTGPEPIKEGDYVLIDLPKENQMTTVSQHVGYRHGNLPRDRLVPLTLPFNAARDTPNKHEIARLVRDMAKGTGSGGAASVQDQHMRYHGTHRVAKTLHDALLRMAVVSLTLANFEMRTDGALRAVLCTDVPKDDQAKKERFEQTAKLLGVPTEAGVRQPAMSDKIKERREKFVCTMLGWDNEHHLVGTNKEIKSFQKNTLKDLFNSTNGAYLNASRMILGKAMTSAPPGSRFDILIGGHCGR